MQITKKYGDLYLLYLQLFSSPFSHSKPSFSPNSVKTYALSALCTPGMTDNSRKMITFATKRSRGTKRGTHTIIQYLNYIYCTELERQAKRWAVSKHNPHIVCIYGYEPNEELNITKFPEMTDEWLDSVAACRHEEAPPYDIVEGPRADDEVWDYGF